MTKTWTYHCIFWYIDIIYYLVYRKYEVGISNKQDNNSRVSESEGSFLNSTSIALQEQPSCPWGCVLAAVFPTFQVLCTCCGNTSILVIGKKSYTFKYTKKPPANCKNSNILKMSLGPTSGIWNFHDFFMFFNILTELFNATCLLEICKKN